MCFHLLEEARQSHTKDVIGWHKRYERFVADFINSHRYIASKDYKQLNAHAEAIGIVEAMLTERQDLAEMLFAKPTFTCKDVQEAIFMFNTNTSLKKGESKAPTFGCTLSSEQIALVRECAEQNKLFDEPNLTDTLLQDWFSCKPGTRLRVAYLVGVAELLETLHDESYIGYEWQSIIGRNQMLLSKRKAIPIKSSSLSSTLSLVRKKPSTKLLSVRRDIGVLRNKLRKMPYIGKYQD